MKTLYFFIGIALSISPLLSYAEDSSKVLAKVNGVPITLKEVEEEVNRIIPQRLFHKDVSPEKMETFKKEALDRIIEKELKYQEAVRQGVKIEKKEIEEKIEDIKKRYPSEKDFKEALKKSKLTRKDLESGIEKELIINKIIYKEVEDKVKISDEDVKNHYEKNKDKYREMEKIKIRHIMIMFDPSKGIEDKERAKAKAEEILKRAKAGEDFAALAYKYSDDPYKVKGGDLGYVHRGRMEPEIEKVAFSLNIGEIMGPVETEYGFYIIKLEDKMPEKQLSFDEVKDRIRKELEKKRREEVKNEWIKSLMDKAKIEYQ